MQQQQQQPSTPLAQSEESYVKFRGSVDQLLRQAPTSQLEIVRIIEVSQRLHLQLLRYRSRHSRTLTRTLGLRRKIAECHARSVIKDKRFTRQDATDKLRDLKASLTIHLHAHHFKLDLYDELFSYDGPMKVILKCVQPGTLMPDVLDVLDEGKATFYDGSIVVDVFDHRMTSAGHNNASDQHHNHHSLTSPIMNSQSSFDMSSHLHLRVLLHPTTETILADVNLINERTGNRLSESTLLEIEAGIVLATEPLVCLDPSPDVGRIAAVVEYNKNKYAVGKSRLKHKELMNEAIAAVELDQSDFGPDSVMSISLESPTNSLHSTAQSRHGFQQMSFVEDWRKRRAGNNSIIGTGGYYAQTVKGGPLRNAKGQVEYLVRTMKLIRKSLKPGGLDLFTTINIFARTNGTHHAIMRWGTRLDTSVDGGTFMFNLGDAMTADSFARSFLTVYTMAEMHKLVFDQKYQIEISRPTSTQPTLSKPMHMPRVTQQPNHFKNEQSPYRTGPTHPQSPQNVPHQNHSSGHMSPSPLQNAQINSMSNPASRISESDQRQNLSLATSPRTEEMSDFHLGQIPSVPGHGINQAAQAISTADKNKQNTIFLQALLRLPYDQVPERHKPLYRNLKSRLAQQANAARNQQSGNPGGAVSASQATALANQRRMMMAQQQGQVQLNQQRQAQQQQAGMIPQQVAMQQHMNAQMQQHMHQQQQQQIQMQQNGIQYGNYSAGLNVNLTPAQLSLLAASSNNNNASNNHMNRNSGGSQQMSSSPQLQQRHARATQQQQQALLNMHASSGSQSPMNLSHLTAQQRQQLLQMNYNQQQQQQ